MLNGIVLGIMVAISYIMTFKKWPERAKKFVVEHELMADFLAGLSVWGILGMVSKTLGAVVGAVVAELILGTALHMFVKKYKEENAQV